MRPDLRNMLPPEDSHSKLHHGLMPWQVAKAFKYARACVPARGLRGLAGVSSMLARHNGFLQEDGLLIRKQALVL